MTIVVKIEIPHQIFQSYNITQLQDMLYSAPPQQYHIRTHTYSHKVNCNHCTYWPYFDPSVVRSYYITLVNSMIPSSQYYITTVPLNLPFLFTFKKHFNTKSNSNIFTAMIHYYMCVNFQCADFYFSSMGTNFHELLFSWVVIFMVTDCTLWIQIMCVCYSWHDYYSKASLILSP